MLRVGNNDSYYRRIKLRSFLVHYKLPLLLISGLLLYGVLLIRSSRHFSQNSQTIYTTTLLHTRIRFTESADIEVPKSTLLFGSYEWSFLIQFTLITTKNQLKQCDQTLTSPPPAVYSIRATSSPTWDRAARGQNRRQPGSGGGDPISASASHCTFIPWHMTSRGHWPHHAWRASIWWGPGELKGVVVQGVENVGKMMGVTRWFLNNFCSVVFSNSWKTF